MSVQKINCVGPNLIYWSANLHKNIFCGAKPVGVTEDSEIFRGNEEGINRCQQSLKFGFRFRRTKSVKTRSSFF